jgi:hypothetical protein
MFLAGETAQTIIFGFNVGILLVMGECYSVETGVSHWRGGETGWDAPLPPSWVAGYDILHSYVITTDSVLPADLSYEFLLKQ